MLAALPPGAERSATLARTERLAALAAAEALAARIFLSTLTHQIGQPGDPLPHRFDPRHDTPDAWRHVTEGSDDLALFLRHASHLLHHLATLPGQLGELVRGFADVLHHADRCDGDGHHRDCYNYKANLEE